MLKKSASATEVAREARDMREGATWKDWIPLVSPVPPVSRVTKFPRSLLEGYLLFGVVGTADQRTRFDVGEAQGHPLLL